MKKIKIKIKIKIKRRNIQSIQHVRMCHASAKIPAGYRCDFSWP